MPFRKGTVASFKEDSFSLSSPFFVPALEACKTEKEVPRMKPQSILLASLLAALPGVLLAGATVEIRSTGTIYLDGEYAGIAPLTLSGLTPGTHRLRVQSSSGTREILVVSPTSANVHRILDGGLLHPLGGIASVGARRSSASSVSYQTVPYQPLSAQTVQVRPVQYQPVVQAAPHVVVQPAPQPVYLPQPVYTPAPVVYPRPYYPRRYCSTGYNPIFSLGRVLGWGHHRRHHRSWGHGGGHGHGYDGGHRGGHGRRH
jgi:hypothetical protein